MFGGGPAPGPGDASDRPTGGPAGSDGDASRPTPIDERWARTLLYNWRRSNILLVLGAVVVAGWYWLAG